ncbi:unnamed protein product [Oncorhynchus mykiss]|uniref:EF-hand domain-containing protein n=1 Tax=Oncorhynchus mykiss TaxID=8022 RepID=A0A060WCW9_ONCMY|nr:unnamed protein product [Oncorhynchus mykiss]
MSWRQIFHTSCVVLLVQLLCLEAVPISLDKTKVNQPEDKASEPSPSVDTGLHYDHMAVDHQALLKQFEYLNHMNPHTFEVEDLDRLIKSATNDLENYDKERHEEFKKYEMTKDHERREHLKTRRWREEEGGRTLRGDEEETCRPSQSQPSTRISSKRSDGLDPEDFDTKTFFKLHDSNGDGFFDEQELEALFTKELEKIYDPTNEEDDMVEMEEERLRMREHVMSEVDTNKDRLVSLEEFLIATKKHEFLEPDGWETLEQNQAYTDEEMRKFEEHLTQQEEDLNQKASDLQKQRDELERQQEQLNSQKVELQQAVEHMERLKTQKVEPPPEVHVEGNAIPEPRGEYHPLPPGPPRYHDCEKAKDLTELRVVCMASDPGFIWRGTVRSGEGWSRRVEVMWKSCWYPRLIGLMSRQLGHHPSAGLEQSPPACNRQADRK